MSLPNRGFALAALACAALAALLYLPGLPGAFVLDDIGNIVENAYLHVLSPQPGAVLDAAFSPQPGSRTRILPMLTFALDHLRAGGLDPASFKATNIAIHALTTLALAWFLRELLPLAGVSRARAPWAALALSLAWALHPLQVSSVLYVVQRMQTMATFFIVLALWAYLRARAAQMRGEPGRTPLLLTGLSWLLALGSKEDAVLLPAYTLALELTVLRFRATDAALARRLRAGYIALALLGLAAYLLWLVPSRWTWDAYYSRDFSSPERLLSQGRVLCMYLWQILVPLPSHMPFYYDWLQPSRGLLEPRTTLPAWLLLAGLLALAWRLRQRRPLFALGVFLFLAGHAVTSNILALELAFEHRNHFPLLGVLLAAGDLLALAASRLRLRPAAGAAACALLLAALATGTFARARAWSSELSLAQESTHLAPASSRAWHSLCMAWFNLGGGMRADNPHLGKAIPACEEAARLSPEVVASLTNAILFKTLRGTIGEADWERYLERLRQVSMTRGEHVKPIWYFMGAMRQGIKLDEARVLATFELICTRAGFEAADYAAMGHFILGETGQPDQAYPYFAAAVRASKDPSFSDTLLAYLRTHGRAPWADRLHTMQGNEHR